MIAVDIGNTRTEIARVSEGTLDEPTWLPSCSDDDVRGYQTELEALFSATTNKSWEGDDIVVASVVPNLTGCFAKFSKGRTLHVVDERSPVSFHIDIPRPETLGADRIVNLEAAYRAYGAPVIVVDMGTAMTIDPLDRTGHFRGGVIAPGAGLSAEALLQRAERLKQFDLRPPTELVGTTTEAAIASGVYFGFAALLDGMIENIQQSMTIESAPVIVTGGAAKTFLPLLRHEVQHEPHLTLRGLYALHQNLHTKGIAHA